MDTEKQTRSLLFNDYHDWYRLRSLLLRLAEWTMIESLFISAGDLRVAAEYAERMNDVDCTYTLKAVKEMGWLPPGKGSGNSDLRATIDKALYAAELLADGYGKPATAEKMREARYALSRLGESA